jgi:hypothetical protein
MFGPCLSVSSGSFDLVILYDRRIKSTITNELHDLQGVSTTKIVVIADNQVSSI